MKIIKIRLKMFFTAIYCLCCLCVAAQTIEQTDVKWSINNNVLTIFCPTYMHNYSQTDVAPWYEYKNQVTKIVISEPTKSIGNYAFYNFSKLKEVQTVKSIERVGNYAFGYCGAIQSIQFPADAALAEIGEYAFIGCFRLERLYVPNNKIQTTQHSFYGLNESFQIIIK